MLVRDFMSTEVEVADPGVTLQEAAQMMKDGDFGVLPVGENDRLIGMLTDRDITINAVAEGIGPGATIREILEEKRVMYCYEDQHADVAAHLMAENQIRRLPVLSREKRLVGIISLGDLAAQDAVEDSSAGETLSEISQH